MRTFEQDLPGLINAVKLIQGPVRQLMVGQEDTYEGKKQLKLWLDYPIEFVVLPRVALRYNAAMLQQFLDLWLLAEPDQSTEPRRLLDVLTTPERRPDTTLFWPEREEWLAEAWAIGQARRWAADKHALPVPEAGCFAEPSYLAPVSE